MSMNKQTLKRHDDIDRDYAFVLGVTLDQYRNGAFDIADALTKGATTGGRYGSISCFIKSVGAPDVRGYDTAVACWGRQQFKIVRYENGWRRWTKRDEIVNATERKRPSDLR
jgi:hypothetical protein